MENNNHFFRVLGLACLIIYLVGFFTGCTIQGPKKIVKESCSLKKLPPSQYPEFSDDMFFDGLAFAVDQSLDYLQRLPPDRRFNFGPDFVDVTRMKKSLTVFRNFILKIPSAADINRFIAENYDVYATPGRNQTGKVLFTGYYEPKLLGSYQRTPEFSIPLYGIPRDLVSVDLSNFSPEFDGKRILGRWNGKSFIPYHNRNEIDFENALNGKAKPLIWVNDPVDAFFLHIQGSGRVYLPNGTSINLHYHTVNGRPYRSIGKYLIEKGKIVRDEMSMQKIRQYLEENPDELKTVLGHNPSYVFFKIVEKGPLGAINVLLTPGRSIATDRRLFPMSSLAFIQSQKPYINGAGEIVSWSGFSRFALNQDTGGAIRGPGRADLFWGCGEYARLAAGHLQHPGKLYFLVLKKTR